MVEKTIIVLNLIGPLHEISRFRFKIQLFCLILVHIKRFVNTGKLFFLFVYIYEESI